VSHSPLMYGAERSLYELVSGLKAAGKAEPVVCFPREGPLPRRLRDLGIPVSILPYSPWASGPMPFHRKMRSLGRNAVAALGLRRVLSATAPDLVVTNTATVPTAAIAAFSMGVPHIWYPHEYGDSGYNVSFHWGRAVTWRLIGRLSSRVVVPSHGLKRHLSKWIPKNRLRVVYSAAETPSDLTHASSENETQLPRLVVIGHLIEGKGQEDAIRALAVLQERGFSPSLTLVGSEQPRYGASLRTIARSLGVDGSITFVDYVEDAFPFLREADIALLCSRRECLPRVIIEAMKSGLPVVGARASGTIELIRDNWNGLLYEPWNSGDLAGRVEALIRDPDLADRLAQTAQAWAHSKFTTKNYVDSFMEVASEVVRERAGRHSAIPTGRAGRRMARHEMEDTRRGRASR
jgi:glycosyltransferase involved in cell wall biosynthesis